MRGIIFKSIAQLFHYIAAAAYRCGTVITMLGHFIVLRRPQ